MNELLDKIFSKMAHQLSGVTIVIIIAGGILTCLLLFIFAKRQIMRFALRSHRGPHAPLGMDACKAMRKEIIRRIDAIPKITYEPKMLRSNEYLEDENKRPCHYFRMRAVDDAKELEQALVNKNVGKRQSFESLRSYLIATLSSNVEPRILHEFSDLYEAARFNPKKFDEEEYKKFSNFLGIIESSLVNFQPKSSIRSPGKTNISNKKSVPLPDDNSRTTPYIRKLSKKEKDKWTNSRSGGRSQDMEEAFPLTEGVQTLHEISIVSANKDHSTVV